MPVAFKFKSNTKDVNARLSNMVATQMPFAISKALNETAKTLVAKNKQDMRMIFDNTVPFTLNAFFFKFAKKGQTSVTIRRKDKQVGRHYLEVQEDGGTRPKTRLENLVQTNLATSRHIGMVSFTHHIKRTKTGAIGGERNRILSALHLTADKTTHSPIYGRSGKTKRSTGYFVPAPTHPLAQGKRFGVYRRTQAGNAQKVMNISERQPVYKPKLKFASRLDRYGRKIFPKKMQSALKFAMATAKFK